MGEQKQTAKEKRTVPEQNDQKPEEIIQIPIPLSAVGQVRDANGRRFFKNARLCAQFLRDNLDIPVLKGIREEDIVDVTEKYQAYLGIQFESDTVKRIRLHLGEGTELFLVSLIEHKSRVDYNVSVQLLRYMTCIWTEYAREMEAKQEGISRTKGFRYPPILPVVYYEGSENWTADMYLKDRVHLKEIFGAYIPDFTYRLVRLHDYTNEELLDRENEMSFLMMINRIQTPEDLEAFLKVEQDRVKSIIDKTPPQVLEIIAETIWSLCMKMNVPLDEAEECVRKVKERNMGYLFENMEKMDIQEERRKTAEARKDAEEAKRLAQQQVEEAKWSAQQQVEEAQKRACDQVMEMRRDAMRNMVLLCKKLGVSEETAAQELMNACGIDRSAALEAVELYWEASAALTEEEQ